MPILTEGRHAGGFLVWEALRDYCRETVVLTGGDHEPGTVLGKIPVRRFVRRPACDVRIREERRRSRS